MHCIQPAYNHLYTKNMYLIYPPSFQNNWGRTNIFKIRTKQPTIVVLKAPFHYKVGKHRLTLREFIFKQETHVFIPSSTQADSALNIIKNLEAHVIDSPVSMGVVTQTKSSCTEFYFTLTKFFFL